MSIQRGWSLDAQTWTTLASTITQNSWKRAYLTPDYQSRIPTHSGVYVMCVDTEFLPVEGPPFSKMYSAIYVGQAKNLRNRFNDHLRGYADVRRARETFRRIHYWHTGVAEDRLSFVEQCLIDALGPTANRSNPIKAKSLDPVRA